MNAPTPGWHPDPTGRHEYRYWEGGAWTDDVSDGGATSVDPIDGAAAPTAPADATQQYTPQTGPGQPGPQSGGFPAAGGPGYGGYPSGSGQFPAGQPVKSGPSTGLLVGLAAVAVALVAGIAFLVASSGDDDDTATDGTTTTEDTGDGGDGGDGDDTTTTETSDTTAPDDGGDLSTDGIVDLMAIGIQQQSDQITEEQAQCAAQAMVDELGTETIMEMGTSGSNPFEDGSLTTEQQVALVEAMTECIPIEVLAEIGMESGG